MKRKATSAAALACCLALVGCSAGRQIHGTRDDPPGAPVKSAVLLDAESGWALTETRLAFSNDRGEKWHDLTPIDIPGGALRAAEFRLSGRGWLAGESPRGRLRLYRFVEGAWRSSAQSVEGSNAVMSFRSETDGWLLTTGEDGAVDLYETTDGGETWADIGAGVADPRALVSVSEREAWARSGRTVVRTRDGGKTWLPVPGARSLPARVATGWTFVSGTGSSVRSSSLAGSSGGSLPLEVGPGDEVGLTAAGSIATATTRGAVAIVAPCCTIVGVEGLPRPILSASFGDRENGWVVAGSPAAVYATSDGGRTWTKRIA